MSATDAPGCACDSTSVTRLTGTTIEAMLAMVLAAMTMGESRIAGLPDDPGVAPLAACLAALGAIVTPQPDAAWRIAGRGVGGLAEPAEALDIGRSDTAATLLAGALVGHALFAVIAGDTDVAGLPGLLGATGARLASRAQGRLPLAVQGTAAPLPPACRMPGDQPALLAAVLLTGLCARGDTSVVLDGARGDGVIRVLRAFGARLEVTTDGDVRTVTLAGQPELTAANIVFAPPPIIAIDGPAAAGKGTLARRIAAALGVPYLDTGLLYRAVGRRVLDAGGEPAEPATAAAAALALQPADLQRGDLRGPQADAAAAAVAAIPAVRAALLAFQRGFARDAGGVLDGRDIGTVIFPDATLKLFVTASPDARAHRRWLELQARGAAASLDEVAADMRLRDAADAARAAAPLRPAADAVLLDTTTLDADAAFAQAMAAVRARLASPGSA
jgi:cytidylate kinase